MGQGPVIAAGHGPLVVGDDRDAAQDPNGHHLGPAGRGAGGVGLAHDVLLRERSAGGDRLPQQDVSQPFTAQVPEHVHVVGDVGPNPHAVLTRGVPRDRVGGLEAGQGLGCHLVCEVSLDDGWQDRGCHGQVVFRIGLKSGLAIFIRDTNRYGLNARIRLSTVTMPVRPSSRSCSTFTRDTVTPCRDREVARCGSRHG